MYARGSTKNIYDFELGRGSTKIFWHVEGGLWKILTRFAVYKHSDPVHYPIINVKFLIQYLYFVFSGMLYSIQFPFLYREYVSICTSTLIFMGMYLWFWILLIFHNENHSGLFQTSPVIFDILHELRRQYTWCTGYLARIVQLHFRHKKQSIFLTKVTWKC